MAQIAIHHKYITAGSTVIERNGICVGSSAHDSVFICMQSKGQMLNAGQIK